MSSAVLRVTSPNPKGQQVSAAVKIGVDAHKRTHTLVAADELGRQVATKTVKANTEGHLAALEWAARWAQRAWAVEDCRHLTRRLEGDLLRAGETVLRVPTVLMAEARRSGRERGKSDPIDALAVARAAWREGDLPAASLEGTTRELRLLVDHRDDLVAERTRVVCRLRWHLHELAPDLEVPAKGFRRHCVIDAVRRHLDGLAGTVAVIAREQLERIAELTRRAKELERQIEQLVHELGPALLGIPGCGALTAAKIIGETAGAGRFRSKAAYARWNGTAPIPVWSGNPNRFRLNRGGNRQVNAALHRIAITQAGRPTLGRAYIQRRTTSGDSNREALRLLRRRLSDVVFRALLVDEAARNPLIDTEKSLRAA
jgi:transposase